MSEKDRVAGVAMNLTLLFLTFPLSISYPLNFDLGLYLRFEKWYNIISKPNRFQFSPNDKILTGR